MKIKQAVIFAGGRGERLRPLTDDIPKPMVPIAGQPFLDYLLASLIKVGISKVLILVGYRANVIMDHYDRGENHGFSIDYSVGTTEDLTGRRLINAYDQLEDHFLLLYGDNFWPVPLNDMATNYQRLKVPVTTTVFSNKQGTGEYGFENNVAVSETGLIKAYDKKRCLADLNGVDIGYFIVDKSVLNPDEPGNFSFEEKVLTQLVEQHRLGAFVTDEQYYFVTNASTLRNFERYAVVNKILSITGEMAKP